jgi:amino acid transporter
MANIVGLILGAIIIVLVILLFPFLLGVTFTASVVLLPILLAIALVGVIIWLFRNNSKKPTATIYRPDVDIEMI